MDAKIKPQKGSNQAFNQLRMLEERVRQSGASLPELNPRTFWNAVKCRVGGFNVVFPLLDVNEIIENKNLKPLPGCAAWVKGVLNFRGRLLPVYGISDYFNAKPKQAAGRKGQIIVIEQGAMLCGLVADELCGMQKLYHDEDNAVSDEDKPSDESLLEYAGPALKLQEETWYQLDVLRLAKELYHANPTVSNQSAGKQRQI